MLFPSPPIERPQNVGAYRKKPSEAQFHMEEVQISFEIQSLDLRRNPYL